MRSVTQQSAEKAIEKLEACEDTDEHGDEAEVCHISYWKVEVQCVKCLNSPPSQLDKATVSLLSCVVTLCQSALSKDAPHAPSELVVTLQILHGTILLFELSIQL